MSECPFSFATETPNPSLKLSPNGVPALEWAAIQDVLVVSGGVSRETDHDLKSKLVRIVAMLTRMAMKFDGVSETLSEYNQSGEHEHEHEHENAHDEEPEPSDADEGLDRPFLTWVESTPRPR